MGLVKTPDVDQTADSKVVTVQVPVKRVGVLEGPCKNYNRPAFPQRP